MCVLRIIYAHYFLFARATYSCKFPTRQINHVSLKHNNFMWNAMLNTILYSKYHTLCLHKHMAKYRAKLMFIKQIPKALSRLPYFTIWPNCQVHFPLWIAWMSFKMLTKINFLGCPRHECLFPGLPKLLPKNIRLPLFVCLCLFFPCKLIGLPLSISLPSLSLSLLLFFCWLDGSLELVRSPFKIQTTPKLNFWTFERKLKVLTSIFF